MITAFPVVAGLNSARYLFLYRNGVVAEPFTPFGIVLPVGTEGGRLNWHDRKKRTDRASIPGPFSSNYGTG